MRWIRTALTFLVLVAGSQASSASELDRMHNGMRQIREIAAKLYDDVECTAKVDQVTEQMPNVGWLLLLACVNQDKFTDFNALVGPKWSGRFRQLSLEQRARIATHVLANAGIWSEAQLRTLARHGVKLKELQETRGYYQRPQRDQFVLFRARVLKRVLENDGRIQLYMVERVLEDSSGNQDVWSTSGFDVHARVHDDFALPVLPPNEYVFLGKLQRNIEVVSHVQIIDVYPPGVNTTGL
jgi:hypothetical protein